MDARTYANIKHGNQKYGQYPYVVHLDAVVATLKEFGYHSRDLIDAGYLHDVLEDTFTHPFELAEHFGAEVSTLVLAVTGVGKDRAAKTEQTIKNLQFYRPAIPLKMADRLTNMRFSSKEKRGHIKMYSQELSKYREVFAMYNPKMFREMQSLCVNT